MKRETIAENPKLFKLWNYKKNINLNPYEITCGMAKKVWWICSRGHEWLANIYSLNNDWESCPICIKEYRTSLPERIIYYYLKQIFEDCIENYKDIDKGISELDIFVPRFNFAIEYDGQRFHKDEKDIKKNKICKHCNIDLLRIREPGLNKLDDCYNYIMKTPTDYENMVKYVFEFIKYKYNYDIDCSVDLKRDMNNIHELIDYKNKENSLKNMFPNLVNEWSAKNLKLLPENVTPNSNKIVWWEGKCGHSFQSRIADRTKGNKCPYCAGKQVLIGFNDLKTIYPELAKEFSNKNKNTVDNYTKKSGKKVWWKCPKGHEYEEIISNRVKGSNCPYCSNHKVMTGYNDLATTHPQLLEEWNYEKNANLKPTNIVAGTSKKLWWKCKKCGNEWQATGNKRINGRGCPKCRYVTVSEKAKERYSRKKLSSDWEFFCC